MMKKLAILTVVALFVAGTAQAATIGVHIGNITFNDNPMAPTDEAGIVPQQYWNNLDDDQKLYDEDENVLHSGATAGKFVDSDGATVADFDVGYDDGGDGKMGDPAGDKTGDHKLLQSLIKAGSGADDTMDISLTNIPYDTYDVIVYISREAGEDQVITVSDGTTTYYVDQFVGSTAAYNEDGDGNVQYVRSEATTEAGATSDANYVRFEGLSGTSQTITAGNNGDTWGVGVAGIQIVPEPATMALLGFGGIGLVLRRRRRA